MMSTIVRAVIICDVVAIGGLPACGEQLLAANSMFGVNAAKDAAGWKTGKDGHEYCPKHGYLAGSS